MRGKEAKVKFRVLGYEFIFIFMFWSVFFVSSSFGVCFLVVVVVLGRVIFLDLF